MLAEYVPQPVKDFYAGFPLVTLPEAYSPHRVQAPTTPELWVRLPFLPSSPLFDQLLAQTRSLPSCLGVKQIAPRLEGEEWSSHPRSLRMQLLLRLAGVEGVEWKVWETEKTAPEGPFPLHHLSLLAPSQEASQRSRR